MKKIKDNIEINGTKLRKLYIKNYKMFQDFSMDFTFEDKPLPIIILAGINGSGKTTLLEYIIDNRNFVEDDNWLEVEDSKGDIYNTKDYIFTIDGIYAKVYEHIESIKNIEKELVRFWYNQVKFHNKRNNEITEVLQEFISDIFNGLKFDFNYSYIDEADNIFFQNKKNAKFRINELSTGEQTLLTKVLYLFLKNYKNKVILIDEPELSLHPSLQNRVLKIYENFATKNNCQIVIATHSPHIIGSAKNEYIQLLKQDDDKIVVIRDIERSYGLEFEDILTDIMDIENIRTPDVAKDINRVWELIKDENYESSEYKILYNNLKEILGDLDKDMVLFRLEIARIKSRNAKSK